MKTKRERIQAFIGAEMSERTKIFSEALEGKKVVRVKRYEEWDRQNKGIYRKELEGKIGIAGELKAIGVSDTHGNKLVLVTIEGVAYLFWTDSLEELT